MRVQIWTDRQGNFAVCQRGDQLFRAVDINTFYNTIVDAKNVRSPRNWDQLLEDWKDDLLDSELIDEDRYLTPETLEMIQEMNEI